MSSTQNKTLIPFLKQGSTFEDDEFIRLFRLQATLNPAYAAYLEKNKINPISITSWKDIPAIPTDAFKSATNPTCFNISVQNVTTFLTSGTTSDIRGSHHFRNTGVYEQSILEGWKSLSIPKLHVDTLLLTPNRKESPNSSLSHMMETLKSNFCPKAKFLLSSGVLDIDTFRKTVESQRPISLIGTALAFLQLFETLAENNETISLPADSWAMETGGYKGTDKSLTKEGLYHQFKRHLGLTEQNIWNEYSMTELSSQFYTCGIGAPHRGPAWTRIKVISPETMQPVEVGEMGYLVIYDLANYDSCLAIMTQDLAIYHDDRSFTLIGRDPSALPRGCSRSL